MDMSEQLVAALRVNQQEGREDMLTQSARQEMLPPTHPPQRKAAKGVKYVIEACQPASVRKGGRRARSLSTGVDGTPRPSATGKFTAIRRAASLTRPQAVSQIDKRHKFAEENAQVPVTKKGAPSGATQAAIKRKGKEKVVKKLIKEMKPAERHQGEKLVVKGPSGAVTTDPPFFTGQFRIGDHTRKHKEYIKEEFRQIKDNDSKIDFENKDKLHETDKGAHKRKYLEYIQNAFRGMKDHDSRFGETVTIEDRYTKLLILNNYSNRTDKEHEIISYGERHLRFMAERAENSYTSIEDLFSPQKDGHVPRTVVLQGVSGIGKTMTTRKIMFDWASGSLFQERFEYVFYIHCREYSQRGAQRPIADLIIPSIDGEPLLSMSEIEDNPKKVLFIIDGFDELKITEGLLFDDPDKKSPEGKTIFSLIRKRYLSDSYIIITTRPTAMDALEKCVKDGRLAEILGFSEDDRMEYFEKFFGNDIQSAKAIKIVKENEIVYTMCFVPIVCWIVCTVIKEQIENNEESLFDLRTITSVYLLLFFNLLKQQNRDSGQQHITNNLKSLCALAEEGVYLQKILFEENDLRKHGVNILAVQGLFLKKNIFKKSTDISHSYSFIHLSIQEFFAALSYILQENATTTENTESPQRNVIQLLTDYTESEYNHWMLTARFLFGLLNTERWNKIERKLQWKVSPEIKPAVQAWIMEQLKREEDDLTSHTMDLFHCLYETQDEEFVKKGSECVKHIILAPSNIRSKMISMEWRVLEYCLKYSEVKTISLNNIGMRPEDVRTLMQVLMKCSTLRLVKCSLTDSSCEDLASVLKTNPSLKHLKLNGNKLGDSGAKKLCEGLKHPECKLQELRLEECSLTASCCKDLTSVLKTNTSLTELDLGGNELGDSGVKKLCEGIKHPGCKLKTLGLQRCSLTDSCCGDLASVLRTSTSLQELWLNENDMGHCGLKALCGGLRHLRCKLLKLWY
ncbi:NACHT, LRR and PYD domains-containing protein 12-like [Lissotriton helveticus]